MTRRLCLLGLYIASLCALVAGFFILVRVVVETLRHTQVTP